MSTRKSSIFYGSLIAVSSLVVGMVIASRLDLTPLSSAADGPLTIPATNSDPIGGQLDATTFRNIAQLAGPAVVSLEVRVLREVRAPGDSLREFFGLPLPSVPPDGRGGDEVQEMPSTGAGSGFIIDKAGYILTNNHVVEDAQAITVRLSTMSEFAEGLPAKIVGRDELTDTALLQLTELPSEALPVVRFGDSAVMAPGDWVMAIGNPFNYANTVTVGIVSAVGRQNRVAYQRTGEFIQTDAAINRGNSGGPLLNIRGEVIGINTMIVTNDPIGGGNVGIGFAVPINTVRDLLPQLHEGRVTRGRIGVTVDRRLLSDQDAEDLGLPGPFGAEVTTAPRGEPAYEGGIRAGDVIIEVNGSEVRDNNALVSMIMATRPGTTVPIKVVRSKRTMTFNVTVAELDLAAEQQAVVRGRPSGPERAQPEDTGLGMTVAPLSAENRRELQLPAGREGVVILEVTPFGPAAQAGLAPNDIILTFQGEAIGSPEALSAAVNALPTGRTARLIVWREGEELLVQVRKR